ncbi:MAG: hypothetical protein ACM3ZE_04210 [Myxococcales bacterium]
MSSSDHPGVARVRPAAPVASESLQRFKQGEISLQEYLDERTERALDHVRGWVSPQTLETVRTTIREQLRNDPVVLELVRRATGQVSSRSPENLA